MDFRGFLSGIQFASPLSSAAWGVLATIPAGIVLFYFLKLRRRAVQVPSTLLWQRSIEDLHVNSLFQRLRRSLLLFLQLAVVLLAMLALAGPKLKGMDQAGQRYVLAIDHSASMQATDMKPTRLAVAKQTAKKLVDSIQRGDLVMVIAFAENARVVSSYTGDRQLLKQRIDSIEPSQATTSLREALQVAAGLANPSRQRDEVPEGVVATQVVPPKLKIYTDGGFADVENFSLGNLEPEVVVIGPPPPPVTTTNSEPVDPKAAAKSNPSDNIAILALQSRRSEEQGDTYQVFGRVHNYRSTAIDTEAQLLRHDPDAPGNPPKLIDAIALKLAPKSQESFKFDLSEPGLAQLEVRLMVDDAQPLDDRAFAVVGNSRKAQVLVVTSGNRYLTDTFATETANERADVLIATPDESKKDPLAREIKAGRFDLVIFDHYRPESPPESNALYFGVLPPGPAYANARTVEQPVILDWDTTHPLLRYIRDLPTVAILKAVMVDPPEGATNLIESDHGPLAFLAPREGFTDAVVTFAMLDGDRFNSNWYRNISYPLFLLNSLQFLGNARDSAGDEVHLPGRPVLIRADSAGEQVQVTSPDGKRVEVVKRSTQGGFMANQVGTTGLYQARWKPSGLLPFAVNQFDARESDLATRGLVPAGIPEDSTRAESYKIKIGYNPVSGTRQPRPVRKDWWKPIAVLALGVLLFEWYIYNRRVYL